ncbi:phage tail repeat-like family [Trichomonas vaginalis G3]|uniref:phage tail repeat-like family n=1 Tax=Trichomonas vaginalis (strain ATCC PRA-98 / G3) TaxID=412133 RepID=UPI0021E5529C|nr:phage tail repeat-like family [Trichomonas vaginalis G3]KAI5550398.1 phage tail repeat-like family [Trichomonas vaginalis G3]
MTYIINTPQPTTAFDPNSTVCSVPFINDSSLIELRDSTVNESLKASLMKIIDFNSFMNTYNSFINVSYTSKEGKPKTIDKAVYEIKAPMTKLNSLTFDGDSFVNDITSGKTILTKEYLKSHVSEFVEIEKEGGIKFDPLNFIFSLANAGINFAEWTTIQSEINAIWTFLGSKAGMGELVNAARTLGETGNFVDGFKRLVSNVLTNTKKLFRYTVHNGRIFEQIATNPPVMTALMMVRDIKPRNDGNEEHEQQDTGRVIRDIKNVYPEVIDLFRGVNDSISNHSITLNEENKLTDYIFVIIAELMKRINEKGIGDIINVSDVMMKRNFDSLFTKPKTEYSLYDVITELMKKINDNKSSGGRVELEVNDVNEKLAEKADKNHVHYITSDEQIITDYHGYLTQDEEVKTKDVNERRYKFIRTKGYDIHCTVQYDTGIAPQTFGYNAEIYASYFFVNGVLVEPRFMLRVKAKITFEDAIKSKADKNELDAMNKVLKSHKHNISDINELQTSLDNKADKNHTHEFFTTVRADDIILNFDLGSSAPLENPSTSVKDSLNSLDNSCRNIEGHARNFEAHELPAMLDKKADKNHTHEFFTTVGIESIEGTVEGTDGDALYYKPPNFPQGLTSNENITTKKDIRCKNVYVMNDENNVKFTAQDLYDNKADKNHTHEEFQTIRIKEINAYIEKVTKTGRDGTPLVEQNIYPPTFPNGLITNNINIVDGDGFINVKHELQTLKTEILQTLYPVGSIYTSMNSTNPASVLGFGTWKQIVDKFLYCARYSKQTGGSKKIKEANLPPHTHTGTTNFSGDHSHSLRDHPLYNSEYEAGNDVLSPSYNNAAKKIFRPTEPGGNHSHTFTTNPTGSGADYMPPFVTVFAWYRVQ